MKQVLQRLKLPPIFFYQIAIKQTGNLHISKQKQLRIIVIHPLTQKQEVAQRQHIHKGKRLA